ncbi:hypothetical protein D9V32_09775 [Mycetocola tolaasinivorans]|uniref:Uncharacterized protein n=1 Tax=Mycetocola tolaasinivorans TaxID=76635 RepID=A0A3L7A608_9MICO|nr:hypothetical protein [Mycetocola tolaasinivorans]RLP75739.1 hypothetical protein D9V32_09775 [Mycetocola tolaasinivorans]
MFSKTQKIVTGTALALGVGVLGLAAAGAANAAAPEGDHAGDNAKTATLVEVPGVKLPTDVKVGHATPVGPVDPANIPAGPHTTAPAPKA